MDSAARPMSNSPKLISLLFVCMGNICRSPALAAIMQKKLQEKGDAERFYIDSCALTAYYLGCSADLRMRRSAEKFGVQIEHKARLIEKSDFKIFDLILAVNHEVLAGLEPWASSPEEMDKVRLVTDFSKKFHGQDIPDPYYGGPESFDFVMEMGEEICSELIKYFEK